MNGSGSVSEGVAFRVGLSPIEYLAGFKLHFGKKQRDGVIINYEAVSKV